MKGPGYWKPELQIMVMLRDRIVEGTVEGTMGGSVVIENTKTEPGPEKKEPDALL